MLTVHSVVVSAAYRLFCLPEPGGQRTRGEDRVGP